MWKRSLPVFVLLSLFGGMVWAQNSDRSERITRSDTVTRAPAVTSIAPRVRPAAPNSSAAVAPSNNVGLPSGVGIAGPSSSSGYPSIPVQTYYGYDTDLSISNWYRCNYFVEQLMRDYRFLHGYDYLWRYAQGDSPLTPEAVSLALKSSSSASRQLNLLANHLNHLISSYELGEIDRARFNHQLRTTTRQIREFAKRIRKDYYLDYLDFGSDVDVPDYDEATSLPELKGLAAQLLETAHGIDGTLDGFVHRDLSRVVSVKDLQSPSADSLSKQIDHLAKVIEKSGEEL